MMFKDLGLNDMLYQINFKKAINRIKQGFNFESFTFEELLEMIEINKFYDDRNLFNDIGKELINNNLNEFEQINKSIAKYFSNITSADIKTDLREIKNKKELHPFGYYDCIIKYKSYSKLSNEEFKELIDSKLFYLHNILGSKELVKTFESVIHHEMISNVESIIYLIEKYDVDDATSNKRFNFPNFSDEDIELMIKNYLQSDQINLYYLEALSLHKNDINSYSISRKSKVEIKNTIEREREKMFGKETNAPFNISVTINPAQSIDFPILRKGGALNFELSFSKDFLLSNTTPTGIIGRMYFILELINNQWRLSSTYNPLV